MMDLTQSFTRKCLKRIGLADYGGSLNGAPHWTAVNCFDLIVSKTARQAGHLPAAFVRKIDLGTARKPVFLGQICGSVPDQIKPGCVYGCTSLSLIALTSRFQGGIDDGLGFFLDFAQVFLTDEALSVNLVNVFRPRWPGSKPAVLGYHF